MKDCRPTEELNLEDEKKCRSYEQEALKECHIFEDRQSLLCELKSERENGEPFRSVLHFERLSKCRPKSKGSPKTE